MAGRAENVCPAKRTGRVVANPFHEAFLMENMFTGTNLHILLIVVLEVRKADGALTAFGSIGKGDLGKGIVHEPIDDAVVPTYDTFRDQQKQPHQSSPHNRVDVQQKVNTQVTVFSISLLLIVEQQFIFIVPLRLMRSPFTDYKHYGEDPEVEKSPDNLPVEIFDGEESEERDEEDDVEKQEEMKANDRRLLKFGSGISEESKQVESRKGNHGIDCQSY